MKTYNDLVSILKKNPQSYYMYFTKQNDNYYIMVQDILGLDIEELFCQDFAELLNFVEMIKKDEKIFLNIDSYELLDAEIRFLREAHVFNLSFINFYNFSFKKITLDFKLDPMLYGTYAIYIENYYNELDFIMQHLHLTDGFYKILLNCDKLSFKGGLDGIKELFKRLNEETFYLGNNELKNKNLKLINKYVLDNYGESKLKEIYFENL